MSTSFEALRDMHRERRTFGVRAGIAAAFCLFAVLLLAGRLADLQILRHDYYSTRSDGNRMRVVPIAPVRGLIFDRNGTLMAQNQPSFELAITPEQSGDLNDTIDRLSKLVRITPDDIAHFRDRMKKAPRYRPVVLRANLTPEEVARYELNRYDFQGVDVTAGLVRSYPLGAGASHLVGYVGAITDADYASIDPDLYQGLDQIGRTGIERSHEDQLRGTPGSKIVETNAGGRPLRDLDSKPGHAGQNLVLTIDARLQLLAQQALGELDGAVVALDPRNGEVLALVSKPGFDPEPFVEGIDSASYQALLDDPDRPLYNRALLGTYPPGSTIKPFMALAALNYGVIDPNKHLYCYGTYLLPGSDHKYRCWKRSGHGPLDMEQAIARSCDIYFYQVAQALGIDHITDLMGQFGFGQPTGIDEPGEKSGLLPSREWKRRYRHEVWFPGETLITGIGQGYWQVTPMQLAQATARLAMRGAGFKPHLVQAYESPRTRQLSGVTPEPLPPIPVQDAGDYDQVFAGMHDVTQAVGGTAWSVFHDAPYTVAAKTGSAQVAGLSQEDVVAPKQETLPLRLRDHALFIAFAPIEDPRIVVAVVAEHGGHGGSVAAPVARVLMDQWLLGRVLYQLPTPAQQKQELQNPAPENDDDDANSAQ